MFVVDLIKESKEKVDKMQINYSRVIGFAEGGKWMSGLLSVRREIPNIDYQLIGFIKYGLSSSAFLISWLLIGKLNFIYIIISVFLFYLIEVHFLFVFPLVIDSNKPVFKNSIKLVHYFGFIKSIFTTLVIASYMIVGLANYKKPFYNWYVGCNCIVIWYEKIRNWI